MNAEALNTLVTGAIWRAEQLEEKDVPAVAHAWLEVSVLEERLAQVLPHSKGEGRIARRGAVRAALKANDYDRARLLAEMYGAEKGASRALKAALREMLEENARQAASRYPNAARHYNVREVRDVARHFHEGGAFGLAA